MTMVCGKDGCASSEFLLLPDGRIICADDDCHAVYGTWSAAPVTPEGSHV